MARKHNAKHHRSVSNYAARLTSRGETPTTVRMPFIDRYGRKHTTLDSMLKRVRSDEHEQYGIEQ